METIDFLNKVVTTPQGYFVLATYDGNWKEQWYEWPKDVPSIINEAAIVECDCYFSSYLFDSPRSLKANTLPSKTIQADLDNADILTLELSPSILVQTSRARHQGYWLLGESLDLEAHERLSKKITYGIPECDHSGWAVGRKVRLPNTNNCKYGDKQRVTVAHVSDKIYTRGELELGFITNEVEVNGEIGDEEFIYYPDQEFTVGPQEFLENVRDNLPPKVVAQYNVVAEDRSAALWALECALFRAGLNKYEVYYLAKNCANNKFASLKINASRELAKDVLRAERAGVYDPKSAITAIRQMKLGVVEKKLAIKDTSIAIMKASGTFARGKDTVGWYVHQGKPIPIAPKSSELTAFLENTLGLNYTEPEQHYVLSGLISYAAALPPVATIGALSHYDIATNTLYLHTGRKQVLQISAKGISHVLNGSNGLIFPWHLSFEPFVPLASDINWAQALFGDSLSDVIGLSYEESLALLRVWLLFILFRDLAEARPILAIFGQPGSGKSAMLRRVFAVFYGTEKKIGGISSSNDFDTQTSNFPFVVFDNVDTWEGWLPDRLAQVVNNTDIDRRKLYTDNEIYSVKRQAMVALTAHDPKFGRADVVDRLLILSLTRIPEFKDEASMYREVLEKRNYIWGAIIDDILTIVKTPRFVDNSLQFRIQDFATIGLWISRALNIEAQFRSSITSIRHEQKAFILEDEALLVDALHRAMARNKVTNEWSSITDIWSELELISQDPMGFSKKYRNATILARKLHTLQDALNTVFEVRWQDSDDRRLWWIGSKE